MKPVRLPFAAIGMFAITFFGCSKSELRPVADNQQTADKTANALAGVSTTSCGYHCTYTQGGYGAPNGQPHDFMYANFRKAFPKGFPVGSKECPDGHVVYMRSPQAVTNTLPTGGKPAALTQDYVDTAPKNVLVGQLVTLCLNLGLEKYDPNFSNITTPLKDMIIAADHLPAGQSWLFSMKPTLC